MRPVNCVWHCQGLAAAFAASLSRRCEPCLGTALFLYGPYEASTRLVPDVILPCWQVGEALCGEGLVERDFMYVADVAAALVALLESDVTGPVNIASGFCLPLRDVINRIGAQLRRLELIRLGGRATSASEPPRLAAATHRLRTEVGFAPARGLDEGLAETIAWWQGQTLE